MLAAEMLIMQLFRDAARLGIGSDRLRCHGGNFLDDNCCMRGFRGGGAGQPAGIGPRIGHLQEVVVSSLVNPQRVIPGAVRQTP